MCMNSKINKLFLIFVSFLNLIFSSCTFLYPDKVNKENIVLLSQNQIIEELSKAYEGEFICLEFEANEESKTVKALVRCILNDRIFDFEVVEDHLVNNYFYSYYRQEGLTTKYYAARYESELKQTVEALLDEKFFEVADKITYEYNGVFIRNKISDRFDSAESYINSLKSEEYLRVSYNLIVPFQKNENKEFELLLKAYDLKWVYVNPVYGKI